MLRSAFAERCVQLSPGSYICFMPEEYVEGITNTSRSGVALSQAAHRMMYFVRASSRYLICQPADSHEPDDQCLRNASPLSAGLW